MPLSPRSQGHAAMLAFSALVAGSFALGGLVATLISPAALNALRFILAGALIGVVGLSLGVIRRQDARAPWRYFILGGLFSIYFVTMFEGLKTASPVSTAAVFTLTPILTAVFARGLMGQAIRPLVLLALAIGGIGALWVIFRGDWAAFRIFNIGRGEQIYFVGCVAHALYTPLIPKLNRGEHPISFTFGTLIAGAVILLVYGWPDIVSTQWTSLPQIVWLTLFYTAIAASSMTFVLLQFASLRIPSSKVMAYTYLTPSWVILWQGGLTGDWPPAILYAGVGLTVAALALLLWEKS